MTRRTQILAALAVAMALLGGYAGYWFYVAAQLETGLDDWVEAQKQAGLTIEAERTPVTGFPLAFRTTFRHPHVAGAINGQGFAWQGADVEARVSPLNLHAVRLVSPGHHEIDLGGGATLLDTADLEVSLGFGGNGLLSSAAAHWTGAKLTLPDRRDLTSSAGTVSLTTPSAAPKTDNDPLLQFAIQTADLSLPDGTKMLTADPLRDIEVTGTVKGPMPAAPLRQAFAAWRDAGGTIDLSGFTISQATLTLSGRATIALDPGLQPIVASDLKARGLAPTIDLLVEQHRLHPEDALKMKLFVKGAERDAPGGGKEVATGLTIQGGYLAWGPFKIARVPPVQWP